MGSPPRPFSDSLLRRLLASLAGEEDVVLLETKKISRENHYSLLFRRPVERLICGPDDDPAAFLRQAEARLGSGFYLAGWLSYEFGYLLEPALTAARWTSATGGVKQQVLAELGVYRTPLIYDHLTGGLAGTSEWAAGRGQDDDPAAIGYGLENLRLNMDKAEYLAALARIREYIVAGDTYQVNYTLKYHFDFSGSPEALYLALRRSQSVAYGAFIKAGERTMLSFSPELFFRKKGGRFTVRPMKGTIQRGRTTAEDRELIDFFKADAKTLSENVMIVDLLRNDLGRLLSCCGPGGRVWVRSLFDVETFETLHQMTSTIRGELGPAVQAGQPALSAIVKALFPCGSVTGAPKIRTMEIIRELEKEQRGVYTGAIGYVTPYGEAAFNVPIRTVVITGSRGEMGIGSGIVFDSDPEAEWQECELKARFLTEPAPDFQLLETMLWQPLTGYWLLDLHLERLADSAGYFGFQLDLNQARKLLQQRAESFPGLRRVRLTLDREGVIIITNAEYQPIINPAQGLRAVFSGEKTDSSSAFLFHKTTCRQLYDEERARAVAAGFYEVLFENEKGEVTEGSISNIFIQKGSLYFTPPISCGLLAGVFRRHFMTGQGEQVQEKVLYREDLLAADAVYVANSVRGMVRVEVGEWE